MDTPRPHTTADSARRRADAERERTLALLAQGGDQAAVEELINRWQPRIRQVCGRYFVPGGDADDLHQEGMIGLVQAMRGFDATHGSTFGAFAETCITRQVLMAVRRATRTKHQMLSDALSLDWRDADGAGVCDLVDAPRRDRPEQQAIAREGMAHLSQAADECLSELESQVLVLHAEGYAHAEIAALVGRSDKAIDNAIQRIRRKLGPRMQAWDPGILRA